MKPFNEHNSQNVEIAIGESFLHGDVIVKKIHSLPNNFAEMEKEPKDALAYGEHTGHIHKLFRMDPDALTSVSFDLRVDKDGVKWLKVDAPTVLKHQEHSPRVIPPGIYKIGIQREYDPFTKLARQVQD